MRGWSCFFVLLSCFSVFFTFFLLAFFPSSLHLLPLPWFYTLGTCLFCIIDVHLFTAWMIHYSVLLLPLAFSTHFIVILCFFEAPGRWMGVDKDPFLEEKNIDTCQVVPILKDDTPQSTPCTHTRTQTALQPSFVIVFVWLRIIKSYLPKPFCLFFFFYFHNDAKKEEEITQTVSSSSFRRIEREHDVLFFCAAREGWVAKNHPIPAISRIILSSMHLPIFDTVPLIAQSLSLQLSPTLSLFIAYWHIFPHDFCVPLQW